MPVLSLDPTKGLLRLQDALERLHRNPGRVGSTFGGPGATVYPPINVFSDSGSLVIRAEVPGFGHDQLSITAEPRVLTITGERAPDESDKERVSYHRRERQFGKFSRKVQLPPDLDTEKAEASCRDGVLTVRIPKRPELQPRTISISQN